VKAFKKCTEELLGWRQALAATPIWEVLTLVKGGTVPNVTETLKGLLSGGPFEGNEQEAAKRKLAAFALQFPEALGALAGFRPHLEPGSIDDLLVHLPKPGKGGKVSWLVMDRSGPLGRFFQCVQKGEKAGWSKKFSLAELQPELRAFTENLTRVKDDAEAIRNSCSSFKWNVSQLAVLRANATVVAEYGETVKKLEKVEVMPLTAPIRAAQAASSTIVAVAGVTNVTFEETDSTVSAVNFLEMVHEPANWSGVVDVAGLQRSANPLGKGRLRGCAQCPNVPLTNFRQLAGWSSVENPIKGASAEVCSNEAVQFIFVTVSGHGSSESIECEGIAPSDEVTGSTLYSCVCPPCDAPSANGSCPVTMTVALDGCGVGELLRETVQTEAAGKPKCADSHVVWITATMGCEPAWKCVHVECGRNVVTYGSAFSRSLSQVVYLTPAASFSELGKGRLLGMGSTPWVLCDEEAGQQPLSAVFGVQEQKGGELTVRRLIGGFDQPLLPEPNAFVIVANKSLPSQEALSMMSWGGGSLLGVEQDSEDLFADVGWPAPTRCDHAFDRVDAGELFSDVSLMSGYGPGADLWWGVVYDHVLQAWPSKNRTKKTLQVLRKVRPGHYEKNAFLALAASVGDEAVSRAIEDWCKWREEGGL
jgi:hypothetical protein